MARKKSPAQLEREIEAAVPGWQRGLDMTESRRLAATLKGDPEAKQRTIENQRVAALPNVRIENVGSRVRVYVSSPGVGHSKVRAVATALKAFVPATPHIEPWGVWIEVHAAADAKKAEARVVEALRFAGYRV